MSPRRCPRRCKPRATREEYRAWAEVRYPGMLERLGKESDTVVGHSHGVTRARIQQIRAKLGIASAHAVRWVEIDPILGKVRDTEIARWYGVSAHTIALRRAKRGLAPVPFARAKLPAETMERMRELVGTMSDYAVARELGTIPQYVQRWRKAWGVATQGKYNRGRPIDRAEVARLFALGHTDEQIAQELGSRSALVIARMRIALGLKRKRVYKRKGT